MKEREREREREREEKQREMKIARWRLKLAAGDGEKVRRWGALWQGQFDVPVCQSVCLPASFYHYTVQVNFQEDSATAKQTPHWRVQNSGVRGLRSAKESNSSSSRSSRHHRPRMGANVYRDQWRQSVTWRVSVSKRCCAATFAIAINIIIIIIINNNYHYHHHVLHWCTALMRIKTGKNKGK